MKIRACREGVESIPEDIAGIQSETQQYEEEIEQTKKLEKSIESQYKSYENEIQDRNAKLKQYQEQLLAVKTNIEYAAFLKQIDALKRMNEETSDQIFHLEEEKEQLEEQRREKQNTYKEVKAANDERIAQKEKELKTAEKELKQLSRTENKTKSKISPQLVARFEKIAEARDGIAVVSANGGICNGCYTSIRPQVFDEIRRGGTIVQCESCSRILYYDINQGG